MELEFLIKYIDGFTNPEETRLVEDWLKSAPKNAYYFEKIKQSLGSVKDYQAFSRLDVNKDWASVEKRMKDISGKNRTRLVLRPYFKPLLRIASVLILAVAISSVYLFLKETSKPVAQKVEYNEIIVPVGQKSEISLADGTKIWINAGSKLKLPTQFGVGSRDVWLEGEAFFNVAKNAGKPFFVHTSNVNIKVLGTSFNVRAYPDEKLIETTLIEGLVSLQKISKEGVPEDEIYTLEPNHKAVYFKCKDAYITETLLKEIKKPLTVRKILISEPVNAEIASSWKEGKLIFENEKLVDILPRLERYYGVNIEVEGETLNEVRYTGTIKKISIEQTIKALQITTPFDYEIKENSIIIKSKKNFAYGN